MSYTSTSDPSLCDGIEHPPPLPLRPTHIHIHTFILSSCLRNYHVPILPRPHSHPEYPEGSVVFVLVQQLPPLSLWNKKLWVLDIRKCQTQVIFHLSPKAVRCALRKHYFQSLCIMHEVWDSLLFSRGGEKVLFANSNVKVYVKSTDIHIRRRKKLQDVLPNQI